MKWSIRTRRARGAIMVEFAMVALAFYLLISAVVTFGQMLHAAHVAQDVARVAAREFALAPLPADATFEQALADASVRARIYDPDHLVVDLDNIPGGVDLDTYFATLPTVNRAMRPMMIFDVVDVSGQPHRLLRMPGALLRSSTAPSGFTVGVPRVVSRDGDGRETVEWIPVLEEIRPDRNDPTTGPFSVLSPTAHRGVVAVRVNVPSQSAAMAAFRPGATPFDPNTGSGHEILAQDHNVQELNAAPGAKVGSRSTIGFHAYDGPYGLGHVQALGKELRPFRRLMTGQALFRREVFAEQSQ